MILLFNNKTATAILGEAIPASLAPNAVSIAAVNDQGVAGGVIFREYTRESVRASIVTIRRRWVSREFLAMAADYAFNRMQVKRIWAGCRPDQQAALAFGRHLGFKQVAEIPGMYPGNTPRIIIALERDDCAWLQVPLRAHRVKEAA